MIKTIFEWKDDFEGRIEITPTDGSERAVIFAIAQEAYNFASLDADGSSRINLGDDFYARFINAKFDAAGKITEGDKVLNMDYVDDLCVKAAITKDDKGRLIFSAVPFDTNRKNEGYAHGTMLDSARVSY
ncbi:MAG TPA: hypothetical protein VJB87_05450 [Candidatus Nanoarchaeia archaeon]|nr:hypothetical protein [Candidatus Nanoarchaeia archaeon]